MGPLSQPLKNSSARIALLYLSGTLSWIGGSDWLLGTLFPTAYATIAAFKDWAFALMTAWLLYVLMRGASRRRDTVEKRLRYLAIHDSLTGLLNRACITENIEKAVSRASRDKSKVGVVFIDVDEFKRVNDTHGHQVGDGLLVEIAKRISGVVRAADCIGRFGGDEFVVLAHGENGNDGTQRLAERLVGVFTEPFSIEGRDITVTASIGFALYPDHGEQCEQLIHAADMDMYRVKETGERVALEASFATGEAIQPYRRLLDCVAPRALTEHQ